MTVPLRVIKLGGSLLDWPQLPARFEGWLAVQPPAANVVVVGGGAMVDALRKLDRELGLPAETVHWAAVRVMDLMAELVANRLCGARLLRDWRHPECLSAGPLHVMLVEPFLRHDALSCEPLPCSWDVTSDSIAARVASVLPADELVLLKSVSASRVLTPRQWAAKGLVDRFFPEALSTERVRVVNLREVLPPKAVLSSQRSS